MMSRSLLSIALLAISGCSVLPKDRPADDLYLLKAQGAVMNRPVIAASLTVNEPEASAGLDTQKIAIRDTANHLTFYTGASWAQPLPQMLQGYLVDSVQQAHLFKSASNDKEGIFADIRLSVDIRDFEVENSAASPSVRLRLVAKLIAADSHKVIATIPVEKTATATANHMPDIVAAFNDAANQATGDILLGMANACGGDACIAAEKAE